MSHRRSTPKRQLRTRPVRLSTESGADRSSRTGDDRGEGVISAAIAVLVMAFLGALMWVGFQQMWETTQQQTNDQISRIGG